MDVNIGLVMTEGNKAELLNFVRALLGRVTSEHLNPRDTTLLIEDVEHALMREKNELISVAKVVDSVLAHISCPSEQECLEYFRAWEVVVLSRSDVNIKILLDTILKKWKDSKAPMPQEAVCLQ